MARYTWGPDFAATFPAAPDAPAAGPVLADVELAFSHVDPTAGTIHLAMPAFDSATHVQPDRVHAVLIPPGAAVHTDPAEAVKGSYPKSFADLPTSPAGIPEIVLPRPDGVEAGQPYTGKTVLQFGLETPTETAPTA